MWRVSCWKKQVSSVCLLQGLFSVIFQMPLLLVEGSLTMLQQGWPSKKYVISVIGQVSNLSEHLNPIILKGCVYYGVFVEWLRNKGPTLRVMQTLCASIIWVQTQHFSLRLTHVGNEECVDFTWNGKWPEIQWTHIKMPSSQTAGPLPAVEMVWWKLWRTFIFYRRFSPLALRPSKPLWALGCNQPFPHWFQYMFYR